MLMIGVSCSKSNALVACGIVRINPDYFLRIGCELRFADMPRAARNIVVLYSWATEPALLHQLAERMKALLGCGPHWTLAYHFDVANNVSCWWSLRTAVNNGSLEDSDDGDQRYPCLGQNRRIFAMLSKWMLVSLTLGTLESLRASWLLHLHRELQRASPG